MQQAGANLQDGFLVLQLALQCVEDVPTLIRMAAVSEACKSLVQAHIVYNLPYFVKTEMLRQEQCWKRCRASHDASTTPWMCPDVSVWVVANLY